MVVEKQCIMGDVTGRIGFQFLTFIQLGKLIHCSKAQFPYLNNEEDVVDKALEWLPSSIPNCEFNEHLLLKIIFVCPQASWQ